MTIVIQHTCDNEDAKLMNNNNNNYSSELQGCIFHQVVVGIYKYNYIHILLYFLRRRKNMPLLSEIKASFRFLYCEIGKHLLDFSIAKLYTSPGTDSLFVCSVEKNTLQTETLL